MEHFYQNIHGWSNFLGLSRLLVSSLPEYGGTFVEVGTWKGRSAAFVGVEMGRQGKKGARLYCVDTWEGSDEEAHSADPDVKAGRLFEVCKENLAPIADYVWFERGASVDVAERFEWGSCDVVFLDAGHDYVNVKADLNAWHRRIKPGGYMAGDDLSWPGVADAVGEFFAGREDWQLNVWIGPEKYPVWCAYKLE